MLQIAVLVLLAAAWVVVLAPSVLKSRTKSAHVTARGFEETMQALKRHSDGRELLVPSHPDRIVQASAREGVAVPVGRPDPIRDRRRVVFTRLLAATALAFVVGFVAGGVLWAPFILSALALTGYVALLRQFKVQQEQSRRAVAQMERHLAVVPEHPSWQDQPDYTNEYGYDPYDDPYQVPVEDQWQEPVAVGAGLSPVRNDGWHPQAGIRVRNF